MKNDFCEVVCSFRVSRLLWERGFNCSEALGYYRDEDSGSGEKERIFRFRDGIKSPLSDVSIRKGWLFYAPTHQMAIEWIRVNLSIYIVAEVNMNQEWRFRCLDTETFTLLSDGSGIAYSSLVPEEALEAGMFFVLGGELDSIRENKDRNQHQVW